MYICYGPGLIPGSYTRVWDYNEVCMHLNPGVVHNCGCIGFLSPMWKKFPDFCPKRAP